MSLKFLAVIGTALAAFASYAGASLTQLTGAGAYTVAAHFISAEGVVPGNDVQVDGVKVGTVKSVAIAPDTDSAGGAILTLQIDPKYAPLHTGTRATIRQKGFLGNMYVALTPGADGNQSIANRGSIPIQDTAAPVSLDQVMDVFDPNTRDKMQTATQQGGVMFDGRGQDLNNLLAQLPGITGNLADATANIDASTQQLDALTVEFNRVATQMAAEDQSLRGDIANGASLLDTLAAHETQLQGQITYANQGLSLVNAGLSGHEQDVIALLLAMPDLQARLQRLSTNSDPALADLNMCYPDVIQAIGGLRSATNYQHPAGAQDANGYMLRVYTTIAPPSSEPPGWSSQVNPSTLIPPQASCSGGTPTP